MATPAAGWSAHSLSRRPRPGRRRRHARGMGRKQKFEAKRCLECRRKYRPHGSVGTAQKTCSAKCRRDRHRQTAKASREANLDTSRERERERQARHRRARLKRVGDANVEAARAPMSRTGVSPEITELKRLIAEIGDKVDAMSRTMSRTGLAQKVPVQSGWEAEKRGQEGTEKRGCHGPG